MPLSSHAGFGPEANYRLAACSNICDLSTYQQKSWLRSFLAAPSGSAPLIKGLHRRNLAMPCNTHTGFKLANYQLTADLVNL